VFFGLLKNQEVWVRITHERWSCPRLRKHVLWFRGLEIRIISALDWGGAIQHEGLDTSSSRKEYLVTSDSTYNWWYPEIFWVSWRGEIFLFLPAMKLRSTNTQSVTLPIMLSGHIRTAHIAPEVIYLLTAIGFPPGGSNTVHIYTKTIHITTHNTQHTEQHKNMKCIHPYRQF